LNKILLITIIGILLVGTITSLTITNSLGVSDTFKEKINEISSLIFYNKLVIMNKIFLKEIPKDTKLSLEDSGLEITKNKEGIYKVKAK